MPHQPPARAKMRMARVLMFAAAGAGPYLLCDAASGTSRTWVGPGNGSASGSWSITTDWNPSGVPENGDDVFIGRTVNSLNDTNVTYDYTGPVVLLNSLHVSSNQTLAIPHTSYLTMSANTLEASEEDLGDSGGGGRGRGVMDQSGGTNIVSDLYLGKTAQSSGTSDFGTYNLSGSGFVNVGSFMAVAQAGGGLFNQTGGALRTPNLVLGDLPLSNGTYDLSTGTLHLYSGTSTGTLTIGNFGNGSFLQSGGVIEPEPGNQGYISLGGSTGGTGYYSLSAGTLSTFGGTEEIGYIGAGTFDQTGGTNDLGGGQLHLGELTGSAGYYNLSGTGLIDAGGFGIGFPNNGTAVFDQNGGTVTIGGLGIANNHSTAQGTYKMEDGSLTITGNQIFIAGSGSGSFVQTGGTVSATNTSTFVYLGFSSGSVATYSLSGGTLSIHNGFEYIGEGGAATFTQSGGVHDLAAGFLYVGAGTNSIGYYNLSGTGSLNVGTTLGVGEFGQGTFNMDGGALSAHNIVLGGNSGPTGAFSQTAGQINSTNEYVGYLSSGSFVQSGGGHTVGNTQIIGYSSFAAGTYLLGGGTLQAGYQQISAGTQTTGTFTMTDGTLELTALSVGSAGAGTFAQSGGVTSVSGNCHVGGVSTGVGSMLISGGTLGIGSLSVGYLGTGTLNISDGTLQAGSAELADDPLSKGYLNISGGALSTTTLSLGQNGSSVVNQLGGVVSSSWLADLAVGSTSTSTYSMFDGTLNVARNEIIGDSGAATFSQSQGSNILSGTDPIFTIAQNAGSTGEYILSGTGSFSGAGFDEVGYFGTGTFIQTGGSASADILYVGTEAGSSGTYTLSGNGALTTYGNEYIGDNGAGTFIQSGGTNSLGNGQLILANAAGSSGFYHISGTGVLGASYIGVGMPGGGSATFIQSGGTVSMHILGIANNNLNARGSYSLSGGSLTLSGTDSQADIFVGGSGSGSFTQTGGTISAAPQVNAALLVGYGPGAVGTFALVGGTLALDNGSEYIGDDGNGVFTQTGGIHATGTLNIAGFGGSSGSYNLAAGTLSASNIFVGGTDAAAGGTATLNVGSAARLSVAGTLKAWDAGSVTLASPTRVGAVATSGNGKIDITNSAMVVDYPPGPSPLAGIAALIRSGYASGAWTGAGITSSTAHADIGSAHPTAIGFAEASQIFSSFPATFMGRSVDSSSVLIRHTLAGDANLDGKVDVTDLGALATNWQSTSSTWTGGDFNYDGMVDVTDLGLLATNWQASLAGAPVGDAQSFEEALQSVGLSSPNVPEPIDLALLVGAAALIRRTRRKRRC